MADYKQWLHEVRKKLNKVKIRIIPIDYQTDIIKIIFKKDIDFLFENEHAAFHREQQSRYSLQSLGSFLTFVFFAAIGFSWQELPKFHRELGAGGTSEVYQQ
ncbi:hypothetical protein [Pedobacter sp. P26]|uniref:hypothetical protein n=1 Tax=Pedobacter sp. P26 TaxID=3423956 RepID=UPI003D674396